jgi:hypothetical protein
MSYVFSASNVVSDTETVAFGKSFTIGSSNQENFANSTFTITDLVPGRMYELKTIVQNRGQVVIYNQINEYWPTSNISEYSHMFTAEDFINNITISYDPQSSNTILCNIASLSYEGNANYLFYFANVENETYFKSYIIGPFSKTTTPLLSVNTINQYADPTVHTYTYDIYYSVIINDMYVLSHQEANSRVPSPPDVRPDVRPDVEFGENEIIYASNSITLSSGTISTSTDETMKQYWLFVVHADYIRTLTTEQKHATFENFVEEQLAVGIHNKEVMFSNMSIFYHDTTVTKQYDLQNKTFDYAFVLNNESPLYYETINIDQNNYYMVVLSQYANDNYFMVLIDEYSSESLNWTPLISTISPVTIFDMTLEIPSNANSVQIEDGFIASTEMFTWYIVSKMYMIMDMDNDSIFDTLTIPMDSNQNDLNEFAKTFITNFYSQLSGGEYNDLDYYTGTNTSYVNMSMYQYLQHFFLFNVVQKDDDGEFVVKSDYELAVPYAYMAWAENDSGKVKGIIKVKDPPPEYFPEIEKVEFEFQLTQEN